MFESLSVIFFLSFSCLPIGGDGGPRLPDLGLCGMIPATYDVAIDLNSDNDADSKDERKDGRE